MHRIFDSLLPLAFALAAVPASASGMPDISPLDTRGYIREEAAVPQHFPVAEFWQIMQEELAGEMQEVLEPVKREFSAALVPTGEAEADWNTNSLDLTGHLQSLPGGLADNAVLTLGEVSSLEFFGPIPAGILADWDFVQSGPKAVSPSEADGGIFVAIGPHHLLFMADDETKTGKARCMKNPIEKATDHVIVYRYSGTPFDPGSDASLEAEAEAIVMHSMMGGLSSPIICSVFRRDAEGRLVSLAYMPDGRPLGLMDDDGDRLQIVSEVDLYEQLNANYTSVFTDEDLSGPPEVARDPS